MSEPEVSLRLAMALVTEGMTQDPVDVFVEADHIEIDGVSHFPLRAFMTHHGWQPFSPGRWDTAYTHPDYTAPISVHTRLGPCDVSARLRDGRALMAQCRMGPLHRGKSQEYPLLRGAIGVLMTMEGELGDAYLAAVVPASPKFNELAARWRTAELILRANINILTVGRDGTVSGW